MKKLHFYTFVFYVVLFATLYTAPSQARFFSTQEEALKRAFTGVNNIEKRTLYLTEGEKAKIESIAKAKLDSRLFTYYIGSQSGAVTGYAVITSFMVRTKHAVTMVVLNPDGDIMSVEVLAFYEPEEYIPHRRWFEQFTGRILDDTLWPRRGVRAVTGATMSVNEITREVRKVLSVFKIMILKGN